MFPLTISANKKHDPSLESEKGTSLVCYPASHFDRRVILYLSHNPDILAQNAEHYDKDLSSGNSILSFDKFGLYLGRRPPDWYDDGAKRLVAVISGSPIEPVLCDLLTLWLIWDNKLKARPDKPQIPMQSGHMTSHLLM